MILHAIIPLVNWGMGTALIIVFGVVCVALILLVLNMINSGKKKDN
jgi:uncharacterized membrane protein